MTAAAVEYSAMSSRAGDDAIGPLTSPRLVNLNIAIQSNLSCRGNGTPLKVDTRPPFSLCPAEDFGSRIRAPAANELVIRDMKQQAFHRLALGHSQHRLPSQARQR